MTCTSIISTFHSLFNLKGSSLTFSAQGGRGKEKNLSAEKIGRPSEGAAEGGCGGNSAAPEPKRSPAALIVQSRSQQKSFLFLLEEKIGARKIRKSEENFFAGWRALASGGGAERVIFAQSSFAQSLGYPTKRYFQNFLSQTEALPRGFAARHGRVPQGGTRQNPTARQTKRKPLFASKIIQI